MEGNEGKKRRLDKGRKRWKWRKKERKGRKENEGTKKRSVRNVEGREEDKVTGWNAEWGRKWIRKKSEEKEGILQEEAGDEGQRVGGGGEEKGGTIWAIWPASAILPHIFHIWRKLWGGFLHPLHEQTRQWGGGGGGSWWYLKISTFTHSHKHTHTHSTKSAHTQFLQCDPFRLNWHLHRRECKWDTCWR